jgi:hypothetical protein
MTDQPIEDRDDAPEQEEDLQETQTESGGSDEGALEQSLPDE